MAIYYQNTDISGANTAIALLNNDTLYIGRDADIASTGQAAITGSGNSFVYIYGNVFGVNGLEVGSASSSSEIIIGEDASITGVTGAEAVDVTGSFRITNYGEISIAGNAGYGVFTNGAGVLNNFGHITAGHGVLFGSSNSLISTTFTNFGDVVGYTAAFTGSSGADRVINRGVLQGDVNMGSGNDTFVVADGRLFGTLNGGSGSDTISFEGFNRGVIVDASVGLTWDGQRNQVMTNVENATGTAFADIFFGSESDNVFNAGSSGVDQINGYGGNDTVSYTLSYRSMIVDLTAGATWDGAEGDTLQSIENATGSRFNDTIYGTDGNNVIDGGPEGADTLFGLGGIDTISFVSSENGVIIDMNAGATWDGFNGDTISGFENATGSAFNDSIYGDGGSNVIVGGRGVDLIFTGAGADQVYSASMLDLAAGADTIYDFTAGTDKMVFRTTEGFSGAALFVSGAAPVAANGSPVFLYNTTTGVLQYDSDGTGVNATATTVATFTNLPALALSDFTFV